MDKGSFMAGRRREEPCAAPRKGFARQLLCKLLCKWVTPPLAISLRQGSGEGNSTGCHGCVSRGWKSHWCRGLRPTRLTQPWHSLLPATPPFRSEEHTSELQ